MMNEADRDTIKGSLLQRWIEDLAADRRPSQVDAAGLSEEEIGEVLSLARWWVARSSETPRGVDAESMAHKMGAYASDAIAAEERRETEIVSSSTSLSEALLLASKAWSLNIDELESRLLLKSGTVDRIVSGDLPPHRMNFERLIALLKEMRLAHRDVVELVKGSCLAWAERAYAQPSPTLGRVDGSEPSRAEILQAQTRDLDEEKSEIERFCEDLARWLEVA